MAQLREFIAPVKFLCQKRVKHSSLPKPYERIYHYHIRKTGGTSLNVMFMSLWGERGENLLAEAQRGNYYIKTGGKIIVGWNKYMLQSGKYYYGFSHLPAHQINIPQNSFTVTVLRDPVKRVISHYKNILLMRESQINHPALRVEEKWLGSSFSDFLSRMPKKHLQNQLHMFSREFNVEEAYENISNLSYYFFLEDFSKGIKELNNKLKVNLIPSHHRKSSSAFSCSQRDKNMLKELLEPEYKLMSMLKDK